MTGAGGSPTRGRWGLARKVAVLAAAIAALGGASAHAASLPTVNVSIASSSIAVSGSVHAGAVNLVTSVSGLKRAELILFQLKPGVSPSTLYSTVESKQRNSPESLARLGRIVVDGPSAQMSTVLEAGEYVALVTAGEGGPLPRLHAAFTVGPSANALRLPAAQATEETIDFKFTGPRVLHDGELVDFVNGGFEDHMDLAIPVKSRRDALLLAEDLKAGREKKGAKLIAGQPVSLMGIVSHEAIQQETIEARPGWYVQACFTETQDLREHTRLGMERVIRILA